MPKALTTSFTPAHLILRLDNLGKNEKKIIYKEYLLNLQILLLILPFFKVYIVFLF